MATTILTPTEMSTTMNNITNQFALMLMEAKTKSTKKSGVLMVVDECDPRHYGYMMQHLQLPPQTLVYHFEVSGGGYHSIYFEVPEDVASYIEKMEGKLHIFTKPRRSNFQNKYPSFNNPHNYNYTRQLLSGTFRMERTIFLFSQ